MRVLKDSLKRSLVFLLVFTLAISGVDLTVFAGNTEQPEIASKIKVAMTFYDWSKEDANCDVSSLQYKGSRGYGTTFTYSITIPMDFGDLTDFSDYTKDKVESIVLKSNTDNFQVSYSEPYNDAFQSYLPLGYYSLQDFSSTCQDLFDKYLEVHNISTTKKDDVEQASKDFYNKDYSLIINYDNGRSIDTNVFFYYYDYIPSGSHYMNSLDSIIKETDGSVEYYESPNSATEMIGVLSVPTSKTVVDDDFYKSDDNAIFAVKDGDKYNTYYVDVDGNKNISFPLDDLSDSAKVTSIKFDDNKVYDTTESLKLNVGTDLDDYIKSYSFKEKYYPIFSKKKDDKCGELIYNENSIDEFIDKLVNALTYSGISTLRYKGNLYSTSQLSSNFFKSNNLDILDFFINVEFGYVAHNGGLFNSSEFDSKYKDNNLIRSISDPISMRHWHCFDYNTGSCDTDICNTYPYFCSVISFKKPIKASEFNTLNLDISRDGLSSNYFREHTIYYVDEDSWKGKSRINFIGGSTTSSTKTEYANSLTDSNRYDGQAYSKRFFNSFEGNKYPLIVFYADNDFTLPSKYSDIYTKTLEGLEFSDDFLDGLETVSKSPVSSGNRYIKIPSRDVSNETGTLIYKLGDRKISYASRIKVINKYGISTTSDYSNVGIADYVFSKPRGDYYRLSCSYVHNDGMYLDCTGLTDSQVIDLLNTHYSDCNFTTIDEFYNSDYFLGTQYKFVIPSGTEGLDDYKSCNKYYSTYDENEDGSINIYVPKAIINNFMFSNELRQMEEYFSQFGKKVYKYNAGETSTSITSNLSYTDLATFDSLNISEDDLNLANKVNCYLFLGDCVYSNSWYDETFNNINEISSKIGSSYSVKAIKLCADRISLDNFDEGINKHISDVKKIVDFIEDKGYKIDYETSSMPDIYNLEYTPLSKHMTTVEYDSSKLKVSDEVIDGSIAVLVDSITTDKLIKTSSDVTKKDASLVFNNKDYSSGDECSIIIQVKDSSILNREHGKIRVKNASSSNGVIAYGSSSSKGVSYLTEDTTLGNYVDTSTTPFLGSYVDYKFGNIIFASRPSVVQDLAIDDEGNVTWNKSADEGLGVDADGKSKSDDIVKLESYTLYVSDKDGNELYTTTATPSAVSVTSSAIQTPVVTKSAVSVKKLRGMSLSSSKSDALFTIPESYNVGGNVVTVYATNILGDSDEVSVVIPEKVTPTPVPTPTKAPTPTVEPTKAPTKEPTKAPTKEPTKAPTPTVEPTKAPTPTVEPTKAPTKAPTPTVEPTKEPTKEPTPTVEPTKEPTKEPTPTKVPTPVPTPTKAPTDAPTPTVEPTKEPTPTPVPEYNFIIKDVYHNDDGTTEVKERGNVRIKKGEPYSFSALDSKDYIPRVTKYEGIASKDTEVIFDYDEKEKRVTLQGYVTYSNGKPIKGKLIEISGKETKSDITDSKGFYSIDNVLVGDYDYTLYNSTVAGSGILAKCDIKVTKKNGTVEVKYTDDNCKVDYATKDGVLNVNAKVDEPATPVPTHTSEPTKVPTKEPTKVPTSEPTKVPTSEPTKVPTSEPTKAPTAVPTTSSVVTGTPTPAPTNEPTSKPTETPIVTSEPTKKPKVTQKPTKKPSVTVEPTKKPKTTSKKLVQTGMYSNNTYWGILFLVAGLGIIVVSFKRKK